MPGALSRSSYLASDHSRLGGETCSAAADHGCVLTGHPSVRPTSSRRYQRTCEPITVHCGGGLQHIQPPRLVSPRPITIAHSHEVTEVFDASVASVKTSHSHMSHQEEFVISSSAHLDQPFEIGSRASVVPNHEGCSGVVVEGASSVRSEYTVSGLTTSAASILCCSSVARPLGCSSVVSAGNGGGVNPGAAIPADEDGKRDWARIIRARGRDGMGATANPVPPRSEAVRGVASAAPPQAPGVHEVLDPPPPIVYKEGYTGYQPAATRMQPSPRTMHASSPALASMWATRTALGESRLFSTAASNQPVAGIADGLRWAKAQPRLRATNASAAPRVRNAAQIGVL